MSFAGPFDNYDPQRGDPLTADTVRRLIESAYRTFSITADTPLHVDIGQSGFHFWMENQQARIYVSTTAGPAATAYPFHQLTQDGAGNFITLTNGISGTNLYMPDSSTNVPTGTICEAQYDTAGYYVGWPIGQADVTSIAGGTIVARAGWVNANIQSLSGLKHSYPAQSNVSSSGGFIGHAYISGSDYTRPGLVGDVQAYGQSLSTYHLPSLANCGGFVAFSSTTSGVIVLLCADLANDVLYLSSVAGVNERPAAYGINRSGTLFQGKTGTGGGGDTFNGGICTTLGPAGGTITIGTTPVSGGTNGNLLQIISGKVGQITVPATVGPNATARIWGGF